MHSLCQTCKSIFRHGSRKLTPHHQSLADLERSAGERCFICTMLLAEIVSRRQSRTTKAVGDSQVDGSQYPVSVYDMQPDRECPGVLIMTISFNEKGYKTGGGCHSFGLKPLQGKILPAPRIFYFD